VDLLTGAVPAVGATEGRGVDSVGLLIIVGGCSAGLVVEGPEGLVEESAGEEVEIALLGRG
jgi:hypothetical protein